MVLKMYKSLSLVENIILTFSVTYLILTGKKNSSVNKFMYTPKDSYFISRKRYYEQVCTALSFSIQNK